VSTRVTAIVFDFDGVLADSEPLHLRAYQELLEPSGVHLTRDVYYERYLGYDDEGVFQQVSRDFGLLLGDEEIELLIVEKARRFEAMISRSNVLYPAAVPAVLALAASFPLGICSGALRREIELMLQGAALSGAFKFIVSADDVERSKPDPEPYALAAARHGRPPAECVAIEDSHWGLQSAREAGLRTIGVTTTYAADALRPHADVVVTSLAEVTADKLVNW
jgi:beta-phosphoglucomutase